MATRTIDPSSGKRSADDPRKVEQLELEQFNLSFEKILNSACFCSKRARNFEGSKEQFVKQPTFRWKMKLYFELFFWNSRKVSSYFVS